MLGDASRRAKAATSFEWRWGSFESGVPRTRGADRVSHPGRKRQAARAGDCCCKSAGHRVKECLANPTQNSSPTPRDSFRGAKLPLGGFPPADAPDLAADARALCSSRRIRTMKRFRRTRVAPVAEASSTSSMSPSRRAARKSGRRSASSNCRTPVLPRFWRADHRAPRA